MEVIVKVESGGDTDGTQIELIPEMIFLIRCRKLRLDLLEQYNILPWKMYVSDIDRFDELRKGSRK